MSSREFSQSNVSLALHTVNEPWLYSVLWCSGVPAVSSDAPHVLKKLLSPVWLLVSTALKGFMITLVQA